ncbi:MAG: hypothetical protein L3J79_02270, partial [Candidatus Marinimicrobia bacterium]|nr:hypothetical protein [Candidatus Neomarinimicrobiota bacterium]
MAKLTVKFGVGLAYLLISLSTVIATTTGGGLEGYAMDQTASRISMFKEEYGEMPKGWNDPRWNDLMGESLADYLEGSIKIAIPKYYSFLNEMLVTKNKEIRSIKSNEDGGVLIISRAPIRSKSRGVVGRYVIHVDGSGHVINAFIRESDIQSIIARANRHLPELATNGIRDLLTKKDKVSKKSRASSSNNSNSNSGSIDAASFKRPYSEQATGEEAHPEAVEPTPDNPFPYWIFIIGGVVVAGLVGVCKRRYL